MQIDINSNVPIYEQIYQQLSNYINNKILLVKDRLPSVIELSSMLHVNPNAVIKSYRMLEEKKCIHFIPGKGIFVSEIQQDQMMDSKNIKGL